MARPRRGNRGAQQRQTPKGTHAIRYVPIQHQRVYWSEVRKAEDDLGRTLTSPDPAKAKGNEWAVARIVSAFPSLLPAMKDWHAAHPETALLHGRQQLDLNGEAVQNAVKTTETIKASFIWDIAEEACRGSAKVEHVVNSIQTLKDQRTPTLHPVPEMARQRRPFSYPSKYMALTSSRLGCALLWAYLVQQFGEACVVLVGNRDEAIANVPKWRLKYDILEDKASMGPTVMVAKTDVIAYSKLTLTEGHCVEGLEPPLDYEDAHRIHLKMFCSETRQHNVTVQWLVTEDSGGSHTLSLDEIIAIEHAARVDGGYGSYA